MVWQDDEVIQLIREVRHDYLNHLQVVSGYLELEMPRQALAYINRVIENGAREREILSFPGNIALALYRVQLAVGGRGIHLVPESIEVDASEVTDIFVTRMVDIINESFAAADDEDLIIRVSIYRGPGGSIVVRLLDPLHRKTITDTL